MRALVVALLLAGAGAAAAAPGYQLFPVRGVFFPVEEGPSRIDADFRKAIGAGEQAYFARRFREKFPAAAETIAEGNQRRTFAVSLQIARASRYVVRKASGTVDVYLPVTASLYFTNAMTGEVLYTATRTTIKTVTVLPAQAGAGDPRLVALFTATFQGVVDDLVEDARDRFHPAVVSATVAGVWNGLALLDAGADENVAAGDTLADEHGNELEVVSAGAHHAVARSSLGSFTRGGRFAKFTSRTLAEVKRPRVLPLVEAAPAEFPEETIVQLFSDALGANAPVSLVPVNRTFGAVLRALGAQIDLSKEKLSLRELPAFFVRLHVLDPITYERPTNLSYQRLRVTEALAYAEVVDRQGRVIYSGYGRNRVEDEITDGTALGVAARSEIAVKNALLALAKRFGEEFRLQPAQLEIERRGTALVVSDPHGVLVPGAAVRVYRELGRVDGIAEPVRVPLWEAKVGAMERDTAALTPLLQVVEGAPALQERDLVVVEGTRSKEARRNRFSPCGAAENLGALALPEYGDLALSLFTQGYHVPFYSPGLAARVGRLVTGGSGFKQDLKLAEPATEYCVQPVYRVAVAERSCSGSACAEVAQVQFGYRVHQGGADGKVVASNGLGTRMTAAALPLGTSGAARAEALHADLIDEVLKLAPGAAAGLARGKL